MYVCNSRSINKGLAVVYNICQLPDFSVPINTPLSVLPIKTPLGTWVVDKLMYSPISLIGTITKPLSEVIRRK